jgi:nascent polypeptide-associated complex subunit alpha
VPAEIDQETLQRAAQLVRDQTRGEKKARKVFEGLGLAPVSGITRVVLKRSRNVRYLIVSKRLFLDILFHLYDLNMKFNMAMDRIVHWLYLGINCDR